MVSFLIKAYFSSFSENQPLITFSEALPICAARVDALRSHGHQSAALRLAVAVVRTMKQQQLTAQRMWQESMQEQNRNKPNSSKCNDSHQACTSKCKYSDHSRYYDYRDCSQRFSDCQYRQCTSRCYETHRQSSLRCERVNCTVKCCTRSPPMITANKSCENQTPCSSKACASAMWADGWVGHPLDPIGCLFDTLAEASTVPEEQTTRAPSYLGKICLFTYIHSCHYYQNLVQWFKSSVEL